MNVLVIGGYGLVGLSITRALMDRGVNVAGAGRNREIGQRLEPEIDWFDLDISDPQSWQSLQSQLTSFDMIINAAGALQDTGPDNLDAVHVTGVKHLIAACERADIKHLIHISAAGVHPEASTKFFRTKADGEALIKTSDLDWVIFRPGLIVGSAAYGGSTLLRAVAVLPFVTPVIAPDSRVQLTGLADLGQAIADWACQDRPVRQSLDMVSDDFITLEDLMITLRHQMGGSANHVWRLPPVFARVAGMIGDLCGTFGWRSPMRSTAMTVLGEGVEGDPAPLREITGHAQTPARQVLREISAAPQERAYGWLFWLRPVIILTLSLFWIASGVIALAHLDAAVLASGDPAFEIPIILASLMDIALGLAILFKSTHRLAAIGMIAVSLGYLVMASVTQPGLWADPLGPLVKIVPSLILTWVSLILHEDR